MKIKIRPFYAGTAGNQKINVELKSKFQIRI